jgi:hypothetical protein
MLQNRLGHVKPFECLLGGRRAERYEVDSVLTFYSPEAAANPNPNEIKTRVMAKNQKLMNALFQFPSPLARYYFPNDIFVFIANY